MFRYSHIWHEIEHDDADRETMSVTATRPIAGFGRALEKPSDFDAPLPRPKRWRRR